MWFAQDLSIQHNADYVIQSKITFVSQEQNRYHQAEPVI